MGFAIRQQACLDAERRMPCSERWASEVPGGSAGRKVLQAGEPTDVARSMSRAP